MELIALTFIVSFIASVISGFGGGGGGFIMTPYYIWIGLTPQQAVATGKLGGVGVAAGALTAFKGHGLVNKKHLAPLMAINLLCALIAARWLPHIDPSALQSAMGMALILLSPTLFINKKSFLPGQRSKVSIAIGYVLCTVITMAQTMMGAGVATLFLLSLMFFFGMDALQANATKRVAQSVQAVLLAILLFFQGLVLVGHGLAAMAGSFIGCHIGSKFAIKKGADFVKVFLAITMAASGVLLLMFPPGR